jgi:hypothetical protein
MDANSPISNFHFQKTTYALSVPVLGLETFQPLHFFADLAHSTRLLLGNRLPILDLHRRAYRSSIAVPFRL